MKAESTMRKELSRLRKLLREHAERMTPAEASNLRMAVQTLGWALARPGEFQPMAPTRFARDETRRLAGLSASVPTHPRRTT